MPNFFVTRTTAHFDDSPQILRQGEWPVRMGLHLLGTSRHNLAYRDGQEILDPGTPTAAANASVTAAPAQQDKGMTSRGEFGPELTIVLTDSAKGKVTWSHWEQTSAGLAAVYDYSVPSSASHFDVSYCCIRRDVQQELHYGSAGMRGYVPSIMDTEQADTKLFQVTPGYHGTLAIDPNSGAILRITIEAELNNESPISKAATMVQYGPVTIGDRTFMFPVRSMALSVEKPGPNSRPEDPPTLLLNQAIFTSYHRLAATIRMFADAGPAGAPAANPPATGTAASSAVSATPLSPATPSTPPAQPATETSATPPPASEPLPPLPAPIPAPAAPVVPEISVSAASGVPDEPATAAQPQQGDFQLKLASRLVDVGIVAWDKKGHPVKDLKAEDFELYDNGRKQDLRFFTQFSADASAPAPDAAPQRTFSNRAPDAAAATAAPAESGATILLIDESHVAWADLSNARREMLRFISTLAPGERVGLYTMTGLGFRVIQEITTDHAALTAKLQKWMPSAQSVAQAQEEETRNRQAIDEVRNVSDLNSVNGNQLDVVDGANTVDPQLRKMGSDPARASLDHPAPGSAPSFRRERAQGPGLGLVGQRVCGLAEQPGGH